MSSSSFDSFAKLSDSMNSVAVTMGGLHADILAKHNKKTGDIALVCQNIQIELHDHMHNVSIVYNRSLNNLRNILEELSFAQKRQRFEESVAKEIKFSIQDLLKIVEAHKERSRQINNDFLDVQEDIGKEKTDIDIDRPKFNFLQKIDPNKVPKITYAGFEVGQIVALVVNSIFKLINRLKSNKLDGLSKILDKLSENASTLLDLSFKFQESLGETLTKLENYAYRADKLVRHSSQGDPERLVTMATEMIKKTEDLENEFQLLKDKALENEEKLSKTIYRINPRILINK